MATRSDRSTIANFNKVNYYINNTAVNMLIYNFLKT